MSNPVVIALMVQVNLGDEPNATERVNRSWDGFVMRDPDFAELVNVFKNIARGFESISQEALKQNESAKVPETKGKEMLYLLNANERKVLRWVAEGKTNNEIARLVYRAPGRVKNIVSEILSKLYLENRYQLVKYVYENNLMDVLQD